MLIRFSLQALIDFGLSYHSSIHEDKAVDLYVLERAVTSIATQEADVVWQSQLWLVQPD